MFRSAHVLWILVASTASSATVHEVGADFAHFQTEPSFRPVFIDIKADVRVALQAGYIFLTPFNKTKNWEGFGPQIFDQNGDLVWYGNDTTNHRAMDAHVCDYLGGKGTHICYHDGVPEKSAYGIGSIRFFDNTYTQVGEGYEAADDGFPGPDLHELHTPDIDNGHTILHTVYAITAVDLTPYNGPKDGFALDGCFREINILTHAINFQWCALDHLEIWDTEVFIHQSEVNYTTPIAGNGFVDEPWDFFHINAVDKTPEGDYLVSARHLDAILKIAGQSNDMGHKPGEIIWRAGGARSDFELQDVSWARQHMVRHVSTNNTTTIFSHFDNAYDGLKNSSAFSTGQLIAVNNVTRTIQLMTSFDNPEHRLADSQGGYQTLPNGNVFIGWGYEPSYSEYSDSGELLYHAFYWHKDDHELQSFRVYKHQWIGNPQWQPKVLAFALDCAGVFPLHAYASWNGATEHKSWRFFSGPTAFGPWKVTKVDRSGFETSALLRNAPDFAPFVYAEALDNTGKVLGTSDVARTFVPNDFKAGECNQRSCFTPTYFQYSVEFGCGDECLPTLLKPFLSVGVALFAALETGNWLLSALMRFSV